MAWMWTGVGHAYKALREKLVREGAIVPGQDDTTMRFARNQVFAGPSAAAAVVGRAANGRNDWGDPRFGCQLVTGKPEALIELPKRDRYENAGQQVTRSVPVNCRVTGLESRIKQHAYPA
jgi:hypothetical protein